jgi:oligopeptide/dipeptide ABC transporter ATP-binding protein
VKNVGFTLDRGEALAIVGESGSGKSATALGMMGLLGPPTRVEGAVWLNGENLLAAGRRGRNRARGGSIAMVFQDPVSSLNPVRTIGAQMIEGIRWHLRLNKRQAAERAVEALARVGIPAARAKLRAYPFELSGGMCQRVMIGMALSCEPKVLVADEPTTALDVSVQNQILNLLAEVTQELGTSVVLISHDLGVVGGLADRIAVMYGGEIVEIGAAVDVMGDPRHPYTRALLACAPRVKRGPRGPLQAIEGAPPDGTTWPDCCSFAPRCPLSFETCHNHRPPLEDRGGGRAAACWHESSWHGRRATPAGPDRSRLAVREAVVAAPASAEPILSVSGLKVHYRTGGGLLQAGFKGPTVVKAVDGISFDVREGETLGIVGESGSGKSTTARAILQLERLEAGEIRFQGQDLSALSSGALRATRRKIQAVFQNPTSAMNPLLTIEQIVGEPLVAHRAVRPRALRASVDEALSAVHLEPKRFRDRYVHELSGGQRQRVNIARALTLRPSLIVADEPTSALDVSVRAQILNLLRELQSTYRLTYILISHDLSVVRHMSDHVAVMYLGKIVEFADRDSLYERPQHPYTRALLAAVPEIEVVRDGPTRKAVIAGEIPSPADPPPGCHFHPRCPHAMPICSAEEPPFFDGGPDHVAACYLLSPEISERRAG